MTSLLTNKGEDAGHPRGGGDGRQVIQAACESARRPVGDRPVSPGIIAQEIRIAKPDWAGDPGGVSPRRRPAAGATATRPSPPRTPPVTPPPPRSRPAS